MTPISKNTSAPVRLPTHPIPAPANKAAPRTWDCVSANTENQRTRHHAPACKHHYTVQLRRPFEVLPAPMTHIAKKTRLGLRFCK